MKKVVPAVVAGFLLFSAVTSASVPRTYEPIPPEKFALLSPSIPAPSKQPVIVDFKKDAVEPSHRRPITAQPTPKVISKKTTPKPIKNLTDSKRGWQSSNVSWYGPGFYGRRTACGKTYTTTIIGVAHRSLACGTKVEFRYAGKVVIATVIDRGPYVAGRLWDLSGGLCTVLAHCFTGPIEWRIIK